jgi:CheY-like chemotaxis protein
MLQKRANAQVLFVHGSKGACEFVTSTLSRYGFDTVCVSSISVAEEKLQKHDFKVIISDDLIKDGSGYDVLNLARKVTLAPFIMISERQITEAQEKTKLLNFISLGRPFNELDLFGTLGNLILDTDDTSSLLTEAQCVNFLEPLVRLHIDTIVPGSKIGYDIFINIGPDKFIVQSESSNGFSADQLKKIKDAGISDLFMREDELQEFLGCV